MNISLTRTVWKLSIRFQKETPIQKGILSIPDQGNIIKYTDIILLVTRYCLLSKLKWCKTQIVRTHDINQMER